MNEQFKKGDSVKLKKGVKDGSIHNEMITRSDMLFDGECVVKDVDHCAPSTCLLENGFYYGFDSLIKIDAE